MFGVYLRLLQLHVTLLQLHFALHLVVLQSVHQLRLLQELMVQVFSLCHQLLVSSCVLLQVNQTLIPLLLHGRQLSALLLQLTEEDHRVGLGAQTLQLHNNHDPSETKVSELVLSARLFRHKIFT